MPPNPDKLDFQLEQILSHLERMDKRDRMRTWGGFFRSLIAMIPVFLLLWSVWFFYKEGDKFLDKIITKTTEQAAKAAQPSPEMMKQLQNMMKR